MRPSASASPLFLTEKLTLNRWYLVPPLVYETAPFSRDTLSTTRSGSSSEPGNSGLSSSSKMVSSASFVFVVSLDWLLSPVVGGSHFTLYIVEETQAYVYFFIPRL